MEQRFSLRELEFDKIREAIAAFAITDTARERILHLVPMNQTETIVRQLELVDEMQALLTYDDPFPFTSIVNIRPMLSKIAAKGTMLSTDELSRFRLTLETFRKTAQYIYQRKPKYPLLAEQLGAVSRYPEIEDSIHRAVDEYGNLRDEASPELRQIRRDLSHTSSQARKKMDQMARRLTEENLADDPTVTIRDGRLVIPIREQHKNAIRGFIHDISASGQTVFIEPVEALEFNNAIRSLQIREAKEIERILLRLSDQIRERAEDLYRDAECFTELEILYAKAAFARLLNATKPVIHTSGGIHLINARHPILMLKELRKNPDDQKPVVPLTLTLGESPDNRILIISGPNAGGKSVALKTVGLLSLMAQTGLPIPADYGSSLPLFQKILADIGDEQSIENELSTFSSHVRKLASMAEQVDDQTLILIDEIGSSTSPKEGAALAIAVLEYFLRKNSITVVTTHHGELKAFAHHTPGIQNASMQFNPQTLEPTYVFRAGIPGSSYAFDIARRMGLAPQIVQRAHQLAGEEIHQLETLIQDLQIRSSEYEIKLSDLSREKSRLEGLEKLYEDKIRLFKTEEKNLKKKYHAEKEAFIIRAKKEIEDTLTLLRKEQASSEAVRQAREITRQMDEMLREEQKALRRQENYIPVSGHELLPGTRVFVPSMDMEATVLSGPDESGQILIGVGQLQIRLSADQLAKPAETPSAKEPVLQPSTKIHWETSDIRNEIDLRGLTVDEAIARVDEYLSNALVMGFTEVTLIHGKGTGALRKSISRFLQNDRRVQSSRLGQWGEGDTGVTIVTLKER